MRGVYEYPKDSGVWWIHWYDHQGKRHREKAGTKSAAIKLYQKRKTEALQNKKLPELRPRRPVTFDELADDCIQYSKLYKGNLSHRQDNYNMSYLREAFAKMNAESIPSQKIAEFLLGLRAKDRTPATVNRYRALLSLIFRVGIENGKITVNPVKAVKALRENNQRVRFLTEDEEIKLRRVIREHYPDRESHLDIALNTGLRQGEQYGLTWDQVDLGRRLISIPQTKPGDPKHTRLNDVALAAFGNLRQNSQGGSGRVFEIKSPKRWFETSLRLAKIRDFRWHDLRHTIASRLVMDGVPIKAVQQLLGHRTLTMTLRYSHLSPEYQQEVVDRLVKQAKQSGDGTAIKTAIAVRLSP